MARQVLTYPDIPPVLTQAAADTRYSLVAHNHDAAYATVAHLHTGVYLPVAHEPGVDPHTQYYNQARGDARYLQTTTAASTYSPLGHLHTATYVDAIGDGMTGTLTITPAVGAIALLAVGANGVGDTAEQLWVRKTTAPRIVPWHQARSVIRLDQRGALMGDVGGDGFRMASNVYFDTAGAWRRIQTGANASMLSLANGALSFDSAVDGPDGGVLALTTLMTVTPSGATFPVAVSTGGSIGGFIFPERDRAGTYWQWYADTSGARLYHANPGVFNGDRMRMDGSGQLTLMANNSSQAALTVTGNIISNQPEGQPEAVRLGSAYSLPGTYSSARNHVVGEGIVVLKSLGSNIHFGAGTGVAHPQADNTTSIGHPSYRWTSVCAVAGTINTSVYEAKQDFGPLDPKACAQAVLETDWVEYNYRPPEYPEPDELPGLGLEPKERQRKADETRSGHARMVAETAMTRHQKGYVLQSPIHKTHALFGLDDRASASPGSDLAVVACALQHVLLEIAELKARLS